ncbi:MAG: hypothetical protein EAZ43_05135 [Betaproteobacteria bacterium]|nr:MAG: hypothetical protein EAZ43_05135 [Betaproteobacteria bacterium]
MDVWFAHLQPNSINLLTDATGQYRTVANADAMGTEFGNARVWAGIHTRYARHATPVRQKKLDGRVCQFHFADC